MKERTEFCECCGAECTVDEYSMIDVPEGWVLYCMDCWGEINED